MDTLYNEETGEAVTRLNISVDETACGLPSIFDVHEGTLDGTFRFEYPGRRFPPVHFQIRIDNYDINRHMYISTVRVEGQGEYSGGTPGPGRRLDIRVEELP